VNSDEAAKAKSQIKTGRAEIHVMISSAGFSLTPERRTLFSHWHNEEFSGMC
jgi:hypothetical protein